MDKIKKKITKKETKKLEPTSLARNLSYKTMITS